MKKCYRLNGFTLAEMLVVMLILTIVLAAFAPLMTKRKTVDLTSPWRYAANNSDIYYGLGANQTAMIGKISKDSSDISSKLLINKSNNAQAHIAFSSSGSKLGQLFLNGSSVLLGGPSAKIISSLSGATGFGSYVFGGGNMTGNNNTAVGSVSMYSNTSGNSNTAIGHSSLYHNTTGSTNTAVGYDSIYSNTSGSNNTAVGYNSLSTNATGSYNTAVGYNACKNVKLSHRTCIGYDSGPTATEQSLDVLDHNIVYIGNESSMVYIPGDLFVGKNAYLNTDDPDARTAVRPQDWSDKIYVLQKESKGGDRTFILGTGIESSAFKTLFMTSDIRLKAITGENKAGLEQLRRLKVYDYTFKKDKKKIPHVGVVAQDLKKVFPNSVVADLDGYLSISWDEMFYAMLNSIKQLDTLVHGIINEIKIVLEKITGLDNRVQRLEKENKLLREQINAMNKRLEKLEK